MRKLIALLLVGGALAFLSGAAARAVVAHLQAKPTIEYGIAILLGDFQVYHAKAEESLCRKLAATLRFGEDITADIEGQLLPAKFYYCVVIEDGIITDYVHGKDDTPQQNDDRRTEKPRHLESLNQL